MNTRQEKAINDYFKTIEGLDIPAELVSASVKALMEALA